MHRILLNAGFRVLQASNGKRALEVFAERAQEVDLLIADCMMPGMDGPDLAEHLRRQKPELKVLLISGYRTCHRDPLPLSIPIIHKPFSGTEVIDRIHAVMDSIGELPC
jgi:two-component system cell cycle sensor histidine kinase/response regulator CckA